MWCFLLMFFISYFTVHSYWMVHAYFKVTNLCSLSSTLKISSPKSSTGNSCLWNCLFWEIHHCHTTCPTVELAKCLTGKFILLFSLWECYRYMCFWLLIALVFTHFWHVCYFFYFLSLWQTDMVYELLRTSTEYVNSMVWVSCFHFMRCIYIYTMSNFDA